MGVNQTFLSILDDYHKDGYWIGAKWTHHHFAWVDSSLLIDNKADWAPDEPSYTGHDNVCVVMRKNTHHTARNYMWHDHECDTRNYSYICEKV